MFSPHKTLNCAGTLINLEQPIVMGILNLTRDSFYDGGKYLEENAAFRQIEKMLKEGATIIDLGAMSSRPGAAISSPKEELETLMPLLTKARSRFTEAIFSIDTIHAEVAVACIENGAQIINDISGGRYDEAMLSKVVSYKNIPFILMHMKGMPDNMQKSPTYEDVALEVLDFFIERSAKMIALGFHDVILDPGFGFGKTIEHNFELLKKMHVFQMIDLPVLAGLSRKSMLYKTLNIEAEAALNATSVVNYEALNQGARILRVHDVKEAMETIKIWECVN